LETETGFHDVLPTLNSIVFLILETETSFRFPFWKRLATPNTIDLL
jgi:hypothetical protein